MKEIFKEYFVNAGVTKLAVLTILLQAIQTLLFAVADVRIADFVTALEGDANFNALSSLALLVCVFLSNDILAALNHIVWKWAYHDAYTHLSNRVTRRFLDTDYDVYTRNGEGYMTSVLGSVNSVVKGGKAVVNMADLALSFVITLVTIAVVDWHVLIPAAVVYSVGIVIFRIVCKKMYEADLAAENKAKERNDEVQRLIKMFAEVRSFATQDKHFAKVSGLNAECNILYKRKDKLTTSTSSILGISNSMVLVAILMFAIYAVPSGFAPAKVTLLVAYAGSLYRPLVALLEMLDEMSATKAEFQKYKEFMAIQPEVLDGKIELNSFDSSLHLNNVSFKYPGKSENVLEGLELKIKKGESIGICGASGGGKSTLMKLIPRFYDVTSGAIKIDGINVRDLTLSSLRKRIGMVHQQAECFHGTFYENVTYGSPNATEPEVIDACKKAGIYDFITKQEKGFETMIGNAGLTLSGGQKQRVALARVFLQNPDILLLDEATSALDNESEAIVLDSIDAFKGHTIITIAHRLQTIKGCNRIVVVDEHKIAEIGTHQELMARKGIYYKLYNAQDQRKVH